MGTDLDSAPQGPLSGIVVLDFSAVVSGPLCGQILGDLGAEVVKVEPPKGDSSRAMGLPVKEGISPLFSHCNRNKRAITIDLKTSAGQGVARRLAERADLVIENFRPGVAERLGLGYEVLAKDNPGLIYMSISGFGPDGPRSDEPAYDTVIQGLTGLMPQQGGREREPRMVQGVVADKVTALTAAYSAIAALFARGKTEGRGQHIEVPMFDAYTAFLIPDLIGSATFPDEPQVTSVNPHRTWKTADGFVVMMIIEDRQFSGLCHAIGRADLLDDPRAATIVTRQEHGREIFSEVRDALKAYSTHDLLAKARKYGVPMAPVNNVAELLEDPQSLHNGTIFEVEDDPGLGRTRYVRSPPRFSETPSSTRRLPPRPGEHTRVLLREAGLDDSDIDDLIQSGAVAELKADD